MCIKVLQFNHVTEALLFKTDTQKTVHVHSSLMYLISSY